MESLVHNVKDMAPETRLGFETGLGERLQDNQRVYVVVMTPNVEPSDQNKAAAIDDLQKLCKQGTKHRESLGVSVEEADDALAEALEHVRSRKNQP
jgi:hypothetical protein